MFLFWFFLTSGLSAVIPVISPHEASSTAVQETLDHFAAIFKSKLRDLEANGQVEMDRSILSSMSFVKTCGHQLIHPEASFLEGQSDEHQASPPEPGVSQEFSVRVRYPDHESRGFLRSLIESLNAWADQVLLDLKRVNKRTSEIARAYGIDFLRDLSQKLPEGPQSLKNCLDTHSIVSFLEDPKESAEALWESYDRKQIPDQLLVGLRGGTTSEGVSRQVETSMVRLMDDIRSFLGKKQAALQRGSGQVIETIRTLLATKKSI